jgi:flagellar basal-body rod protein FlgB
MTISQKHAMTSPVDSVTTAALGLALDAAQLRQQAISANVANHATEGWVPLGVDFEAQMAQARQVLDSGGQLDAASLAGVQPRLAPLTGTDGLPQPARLDEQVAAMASNAVTYQALARGLSRHFAILSAAVSDGKR